MSQSTLNLKLSQTDTVTEMDAKISSYSKLLETVSDREKPNLRTKLLSAKLMREKFVAMTAFAKAQSILAEMEVLVAENNLKTACEQLDIFKKELDEKTENESLKSKERQTESEPQTRTRESTPKEQENCSNKKVLRKENKKSKSETEKRKRRHSDSNHPKSKKSKISLDNGDSLTSNTISPIKNITNDELRPKTDENQAKKKRSGSSHSKSKKSKKSLENKTKYLTLNTLSSIQSNTNDEQRQKTDNIQTNSDLTKLKTEMNDSYDDEDTIILEEFTNHDTNSVLKAVPQETMSSKMQRFFKKDQFRVKFEAHGDDLS